MRRRVACGAALIVTLGVLACRSPAVEEAVHRAPAPVPVSTEEPEPAPTPAPTPAASQAPGIPPSPLRGLDGAAAELARGQALAALERVAAEPAAAAGSREWFVAAAIKGRAARLTGDPARAVAALEAITEHRDLGRHLPAEVVLLELARALEAWTEGGQLAVDEADRRRREAIKALGKAMGKRPIRELAAMRVMQARLHAAIDGGGAAGRRSAALQALKALKPVIADYPEYPGIAGLELAEARAMIRAGKLADGGAALRRIAVRRAGEPEAEAAWADLQALADQHFRGRVAPFTIGENLERAESARGLRHVELSRSILDGMIDDSKTPPAIRTSARRSRAWTAYKQRDYATCVADLKDIYEHQHSVETREFLARCLDRGAFYDEAIELWLGLVPKKGQAGRPAMWAAVEQAFRGGLYARAAELLVRYERQFKGHAAEREWLDAWLKMRLGQREEAIAAFARVERHQRGEALRASYFRGRLLLGSADEEEREQGIAILRGIVDARGLEYYGLMARQRLLDAGVDPGPEPRVKAMADESSPPEEAAVRELFRGLAADFGDELEALRRGEQLFAAGYVEEARRELRVAIDEYQVISGSKPGYEPRHEDRYAGLAWRRTWQQPKLTPSREARKRLRGGDEGLRKGLRTLALALEDPHRLARLSQNGEGSAKSRWYIRAFRGAVEREAASRGIDPVHLWSLMYTESRFRRHVISPVGARGALQIMPWTGTQLAARLGELDGPFDTDSLFDVDVNVHLAAYYVAELLAKFHGQPAFAYGSYNGGPSNVARWLAAKSRGPVPLELDVYVEEIPFGETARYVRRVLETQANYALLYEGSLPRWSNQVDPRFEDNIDF